MPFHSYDLCGEETDPILGDMTVSKSHNISVVPLGILPDSRCASCTPWRQKAALNVHYEQERCGLAYMVNEFLANRSKYHTKSHRTSTFTVVVVV